MDKAHGLNNLAVFAIYHRKAGGASQQR